MMNRRIVVFLILVILHMPSDGFSSDMATEAKALANTGDYQKAYEKLLVVLDEKETEIKNEQGLTKYYKDELARITGPQPSGDRTYNEAANSLWASAWDLQHDGVFKKVGKEKEEYLNRAVETYKRIVIDYPYSNKAEEAQYRIGRIYYKFIKDDKRAKDAFQRYLDMYPKGSFASEVRETLMRLKKE